jgi:hypothetical protein
VYEFNAVSLSEKITIRVSYDEKEDLSKQAEELKIKLSKYLRLKLITLAVPVQTQVVSVDWDKYNHLSEINYQLKQIGVNINQLAHNANRNWQIGIPTQIEINKLNELSDVIEQLKSEITDMCINIEVATGTRSKS